MMKFTITKTSSPTLNGFINLSETINKVTISIQLIWFIHSVWVHCYTFSYLAKNILYRY